jgi:ABC-type nitrate/sulfonate/bicarbonate transport system substrate-binding protein
VFTQGTGGQTEALAAMEVGAMAGASLTVPATFEARKRGYREIFNISELGVRYLGSAVGAPRRTLEQRPEVADRTLRALAQATSRLQTDREFAIQVLSKYSQSSDRELMAETVDFYRPRYVTDLYPDPRAVQTVLDLEDNPEARRLRVEEVTDYRFVERLRQSGFVEQLPR